MSHDPHDLSGAYVLDALTDTERHRFERHLTRCPGCREETAGLQETAARLAVAASHSPPPALRGKVLDEVRRTRQQPPPSARRFPGGAHAAGAGGGLSRLVAAACLVLAIAIGAQAVRWHDDAERVRNANRQIVAVLAAPDAHSTAGRAPGGPTLTAVTSRTVDKAVITTARLRPLPSSRTYQLWFLGSAAPRSAGVLRAPGRKNEGPLVADKVGDARRIGLTIEPAGGSRLPTTAPIIIVDIT